MRTYLSNKEHLKISRELEKHHAIFERIWTLSGIRFTTSIPTAAVKFNLRGDCIDFMLNAQFWEGLNFTTKCFVLSHECMHIALNHGLRSLEASRTKRGANIANIAQDIVINHALVERYGFFRDDIDPIALQKDGKMRRKYCWVDTIFPEDAEMATDQNYEFYFNRLCKKADAMQEAFDKFMENVEFVDDHDFNQENNDYGEGMPMQLPGMGTEGEESDDKDGDDGEGEGKGKGKDGEGKGKDGEGSSEVGDDEWEYFDSSDYSEDFADMIDKLDRDLSNDDKKTLEKFVNENANSGEELETNPEYGADGKVAGNTGGSGGGQGNSAGTGWTFANKLPVRKRKFEHIVTAWAKKKLTVDEVDVDQWALTDRRFASISGYCDLELPSEVEMDDETTEDDKFDVFFFQDTSGSCSGYTDRFFSIAESMPLERFNMRMFCFDTEVYETTLESRELKGFGGTHFHQLENFIQDELKTNPDMKKYPDAIFVVTDGYGSDILPEKPSNWHWILTPEGSKDNIPKDCNMYDLAKYE